ncbi:Promethin Transmembrane protein 159 [Takifugu flavidus]|uniref:Promethin Transmembrane protein 159 n=2 Tax=Takifugu flavidus TaxID=433684 RepID=A0A5C6NR23_9TELE|nr:Promethin Transmembrane protein 159 [Takifugu flavidus]
MKAILFDTEQTAETFSPPSGQMPPVHSRATSKKVGGSSVSEEEEEQKVEEEREEGGGGGALPGCVRMDGDRDPEQLRGNWALLMTQLRQDPRVSQLLSTRPGQYLLSHPALAPTLLLFAAFAVLPVALFLAFAVVTFIISATGFVFFQGLLLFVGGMSLLCALVGVAFFSVVVSLIFNVFYFVLSSILSHPRLTKHKLQEEEGGRSKLLEDQ